MEVGDPALIARLGQSLYSFEEGAAGAEASFEVVMETQPGLPVPNRSHEVTVSTESGTAESGIDFTLVEATATFAPEDYSAIDGRWVARKWIEVPLIDDAADELEEIFMVTLARDPSLGDRIQVRNPNRTQCDGPYQARIAINDNDEVGVAFLDGDGNPLTDNRLTVREGGQVTYQVKLDRRPAQGVTIAWETGRRRSRSGFARRAILEVLAGRGGNLPGCPPLAGALSSDGGGVAGQRRVRRRASLPPFPVQR